MDCLDHCLNMLKERELEDGLNIIRPVLNRKNYSKLYQVFRIINPKILHLNDYMPSSIQNELLYSGLEHFSKILDEDKFELLASTTVAINRIGDAYEEKNHKKESSL